MEITVKDLWKVLKRSFLFVLAGAMVLGLVFAVYTATRIQKVYQSSAKFFLSPQNTGSVDADTAELNNDLVVGSKYIQTMSDYLMTEETMEQVLRFVEQLRVQNPDNAEYALDHTYKASSLVSLFTFVTPGKEETSLVFTVRCRAYSAKDSRILLEAFGSIINERCRQDVLKGVFLIKTIASPKAGSLVSPNLMTNTLLGAVIGAVLPYAFFLVLAVLDTRIKSEEDVKNRFKYPVLGQIPHL